MDLNNFDSLKQLAQQYIDDDLAYDASSSNKLLLCFLESLGYSPERITSPGAYDLGTNITFQYAVRTANDDSSSNLFFKVIDYGDTIEGYEDVIRNTIVGQTPNNNVKKYYVITNCYLYKVYSNIVNEEELINLKEEGTFNICNLTNNDLPLLNAISEIAISEGKYEIDDDFVYNDEDESKQEGDKETKEEKTKINIKEKLSSLNLSEENKDKVKKIILIILALIILLFVFKFLLNDTAETDIDTQQTNVETQVQEIEDTEKVDLSVPTNTSNIDLSATNISTEGVINIQAVLDLMVSAKDDLSIKLISNLEEGAIVKLGIFCGNESKYIYSKVDSRGQLSEVFSIPSTWGTQLVTVGAYLKFDEKQEQPINVKQKYGETGEFINWNKDYAKNMITFAEINHSNDLVEVLLKEQAAKREKELRESVKRDFQNVDTRIDAFGNIKQVPKGFSFDEANISENTQIYPFIYYDKEDQKSYLYVVCGYVGTQFVRFEGVGFSCDGYNWKYDNGTNAKKNNIVGNKKAEYVYFNNVDKKELIADMNLLTASSKTQLILIGSNNTTFTITENEKAMLKQFLYIYETYYGNGAYVPNTSLFSGESSSLDLSYIKRPDSMLERSSSEINSMLSFEKEIKNKEKNDEEVPEEDKDLLKTMHKTYRPMVTSIEQKIYNSVVSSNPIEMYYDDYESGEQYFKIYFMYDVEGKIEKGYIPYINIYTDRTVIFPIKTIDEYTDKEDKVYAKYTIPESLYIEIKEYINSTQYEEIDL